MAMKKLLGLAAVLEAATGLALMIHPPLLSHLLLGEGVSGAGMALGRVGGFALLGLGLACWPDLESAGANTPALRALLAYNLLATLLPRDRWPISWALVMARRRDPRRADAASRPRVASYRQLDSVQGLQPRRVGLRSNIKGFNYSLVSCIRSSLNISCASFPSYRRKPVSRGN